MSRVAKVPEWALPPIGKGVLSSGGLAPYTPSPPRSSRRPPASCPPVVLLQSPNPAPREPGTEPTRRAVALPSPQCLPELETGVSGSGLPVVRYRYPTHEVGVEPASEARAKRVAPFPPPGASAACRARHAYASGNTRTRRDSEAARDEASIARLEEGLVRQEHRREGRERLFRELEREHGGWCAQAVLKRESEQARSAKAMSGSLEDAGGSPGRQELLESYARAELAARPPQEAPPPADNDSPLRLVSPPRPQDGSLPPGAPAPLPPRPPTAEEVRRRRSSARRRDEAELEALTAKLTDMQGIGGMWSDAGQHLVKLKMKTMRQRRPSFGMWKDPSGRGVSEATRRQCLESRPSSGTTPPAPDPRPGSGRLGLPPVAPKRESVASTTEITQVEVRYTPLNLTHQHEIPAVSPGLEVVADSTTPLLQVMLRLRDGEPTEDVIQAMREALQPPAVPPGFGITALFSLLALADPQAQPHLHQLNRMLEGEYSKATKEGGLRWVGVLGQLASDKSKWIGELAGEGFITPLIGILYSTATARYRGIGALLEAARSPAT
eukprot:Hpha_TRINITY_DN29794_c0_g1::TRINITY_DN29794_c0_g1_i1::g.2748::m.2748